jgi:hypothetical protein
MDSIRGGEVNQGVKSSGIKSKKPINFVQKYMTMVN